MLKRSKKSKKAVKAISNSEQKFKRQVCCCVTDNDANVAKMRRKLEDNERNLKHGCHVHMMHLLPKDLSTTRGIKEKVAEIVKLLL